MENSVIAVQIANGTFVPVLDTSNRKRRRLVVTTVRDNQTEVKIELYRGADSGMADAEYVGSLLIENLEPAESGTPDISVLLGVDEIGNLNATATDTRSGEYQSLSVNLDQLDREGGYGVPDFQLSDEELTMEELSMEESADDELESFSFDELETESDEPESLEEPDLPADEPEELEELDLPADEPDLGADLEELEELDTPGEQPDPLADLADEEFSFDDSFGEEVATGDAASDEAATSAAAEDFSFDTEFEEGIVEADLGDEDFTFDEGGEFEVPPGPVDAREGDEEESLFGEPGAVGTEDEIDDTLTPEEFDRLDSEPVRGAGAVESAEGEDEVQPRRSNAIIFVGYLILALAAIGVLTYLVFRLLEGPPAPPLRAGSIGEVSVALLFLSIPARRISRRLGRRRGRRAR